MKQDFCAWRNDTCKELQKGCYTHHVDGFKTDGIRLIQARARIGEEGQREKEV
jgi:hypothetical protein